MLMVVLIILNFFLLNSLNLRDQEPPARRIKPQLVTTDPDSGPPNLILSAIDGPTWQDQIFIFMESLEIALGRDALDRTRSQRRRTGEQNPTSSTPAATLVKIIIPKDIADNPPPGFRTLMNRYPSLSFVGALPESDLPIVIRRFQGFTSLLGGAPQNTYGHVLLCDLDVVFQRNPFLLSQRMPNGSELVLFAEWRGLKIGQCNVHRRWLDECSTAMDPPYISREQVETYMPLDRVCAGTTYGTSRAMSVYLRTMASELMRSDYRCNDQAVHTHIFYSRLLDAKLTQAGFGSAQLVPNADALLGTVGTTPIVKYNHWGEVQNEKGEVQVAIHQYKTHHIVSTLFWEKYAWVRGLEDTETDLGKVPDLEEDIAWTQRLKDTEGKGDEQILLRYKLGNANAEYCDSREKLCSCKYHDCQMDYSEFE